MATDRSEKTQARAKAAKEFVTLAKKYNPKTVSKLVGHGIHEKLDGVRARWSGGQLISRTQKPFPVPSEVLLELDRVLGDIEADGELLCPTEGFQTAVSIVRNGNSTAKQWFGLLEYHIFDVDTPGLYDDRMEHMEECMCLPGKGLVKVTQPMATVTSHEQIMEYHDAVVAKGGEGLILRDHGQEYVKGRSAVLLKVKVMQDAEAMVIGHQAGEGKFAGMLGALEMKMSNGKEFKIGTGFSDNERRNPPAIKDMVTFRFFGLTDAGLPRHPAFVAVRNYED